MKTAVALSGGIDSLASLVLLKESGHDLLPFHAFFFSPSERDAKIQQQLAGTCQQLKLPFSVLNLAPDFEQMVIKPFIESYLEGLTPNPCALCNRQIKFGLILDWIYSLDAEFMATGHYAGVSRGGRGPSLWRATDKTKDQSYFLSLVPVNRFERVIFPLRDISKLEAADILKQRKIIPPVKTESNEICFIKDDYREFISGIMPDKAVNRPGPIKNRQGIEVGRHQGLWRYTQGQRKGLGVAFKHPLYVLRKDIKTNTLFVGGQEELMTNSCLVCNLNIHEDPALWPEKVFVQTRYRQKAGEASVTIREDQMTVFFSKPRDIPAPGQVATVYTEQGRVLGAGIITDRISP